MKLFNIDFNQFELNEFDGNKKSIINDVNLLYTLRNLNIKRYELYDKITLDVTKIEKATGGYCVPRGYYCPDFYEPFTVGGCDRGKLLKRVTNKSKISYEFCYVNDELTLVKVFDEPDLDCSSEGTQSMEF